MATRRRLHSLVLFALVLGGLSCAPAISPTAGVGASSFEEDEKKLWELSEEGHRLLEKEGVLYQDPELQSYLNDVAASLLAGRLDKLRTALRVSVIKDPFLSAFASPHGAIYLHSGILARLENEAQLAMVLGHELIHLIDRHALKRMYDTENRLAAAHAVQTVLLVALAGAFPKQLADLWVRASVEGYSKELERTADEEGLKAMVEAGYDPSESANVFELLKQNWDETKFVEPFFLGTPSLIQERLEHNLRLLNGRYQQAARQPNRRKNTEEFLTRIHRLLLDNAALDVELGRYKIAQAAIEKHLRREPGSARGHFLAGEVHRRSGRTEDAAKAYLHAASLDANYPAPHRELGLLYRAQSRIEEACLEFEKYLALDPNAVDAPIIAGYMAQTERP